MPIYKNQSRTIAFQSLTTAGAANTTTTPVTQVSVDGGAFANTSAAPQHVGSGCWKLSLTPAELNGDLVILAATAAGCVPSQREIYPESDWTASRAVRQDNLDATVSSRSTYSGADTAGTTTLLARISAQRATNMDNLDAAISTRLATTAYAAAPSAATIAGAILATPANKISTDANGGVALRLDQAVPLTNTAQTVGDALNAARAQGFGPWSLDTNARTLKLFAANGTTVVRTFTLDSVTAPTVRS
jgi:hypothetical protein